jgi:hypothetical protein
MIKIINNDIMRAGVKIGWLSGNDVFDHQGLKLGFYEDNYIFNRSSHKIGYLKGDFLYEINSDRKIRLDENRVYVAGGAFSDLCRAAVRLLLGD